jgi:TRAP transporter TAXI family solute receptor
MGTASLAGTYFPVGVALCRLVNEDRREHGIRCAAQRSAGSVANIRALRAGEIDLALVQSDVQDAALNGTGALAEDGPFPDLRAVLSLYPEALTVVARREAGIAGLGDLPGTRISPGPPGSGQRELWEAVSAAMGWTAEDFAAVLDLAPTDQAAALCEGQIDTFVITIGHPAPTVREAASGCDASLVPVTGPEIAALVGASPYFAEAVILGGLYRGNPAPVATFGVMATLVTRADVADTVIATLVGAAFGKVDALRALDPVLAGLEAEAMANAGRTAPLHPAAQSYFRAQGLAP